MLAQDLEVQKIQEVCTVEEAGYQDNRVDLNGDACAILRVALDEEDVKFSGGVFGRPRRVDGGYLVYLLQGTKRLKVSPLEYLPVEILFSDYGVSKVKKGYVYDLEFKSPPVEPGFASVALVSNPPFATLYLDGKELGPSPKLLQELPAGKHKIKARLQGYKEYSKTYTFAAGTSREMQLTLKKMAPVSVLCNVANPTLRVDDELVTFGANLELSEGEHVLTLSADGFSTLTETIKVKPTGRNTFVFNLYTSVSPRRVPYKMVYIPEAKVLNKGKEECLRAYSIGNTEVTQEFWESVMGSNPSVHLNPQYPVTNVSWDDCQTFIRKLNELTGLSFSLPTEAEWEHAACGGPWRKKNAVAPKVSLDEEAWYAQNAEKKLHKVGKKKANPCGMYDMLGNVSEWCSDKAESSGQNVCRGGDHNDAPYYCTPFFRSSNLHDYKSSSLGFRLVLH